MNLGRTHVDLLQKEESQMLLGELEDLV